MTNPRLGKQINGLENAEVHNMNQELFNELRYFVISISFGALGHCIVRADLVLAGNFVLIKAFRFFSWGHPVHTFRRQLARSLSGILWQVLRVLLRWIMASCCLISRPSSLLFPYPGWELSLFSLQVSHTFWAPDLRFECGCALPEHCSWKSDRERVVGRISEYRDWKIYNVRIEGGVAQEQMRVSWRMRFKTEFFMTWVVCAGSIQNIAWKPSVLTTHDSETDPARTS